MIKRPLVSYSGLIQEIINGDTVSSCLGANQYYKGIPNTTTFTADGMVAPTVIGTLATRSPATNNILARTFRVGIQTASTVGSLASHYWTNANYVSGSGTGLGGFNFIQRFGISDGVSIAGARQFIGMSFSIIAPTNVEPNTLTNSVGLAQLSTDATQWYIVYGGSTAQTAIPLGTAIGAPTLTTTAWEFTLISSPNNSNIIYKLINLGTGVTVTGTILGTSSIIVPSNTTYLAPRIWRCNNATAANAQYDFITLFMEQNV